MKKTFNFSPGFLILTILIILFSITSSGKAKSASNKDLKTTASTYVQDAETAGTPITLRIDSDYYYYVPFEINGTLSTQFPGVMLDSGAQPITDENLLKELFLYPSLVRNFSSSIKDFNELAAAKTAAFAKYCRILEVQSIKFKEINMSGNVSGVLYEGTKLAFDAVGLVKSAVSGFANLIKDLAKEKVKSAVVSSISSADSRAILESTQKASDEAARAYNSCKTAMEAWNMSQSTTGKASGVYAKAATEETLNMYSHEATAIEGLKKAFARVNNYPKLVTKINKKRFKAGVAGLTKLINQLTDEKKYWTAANIDATDANMLELWTAEQISRAGATQISNGGLTSCLSVDLSRDSVTYNYTVQSAPCSAYNNNVSSNEVKLSCAQSSASWRSHFVKKLNVAGMDKVKIKANLEMNDKGAFFYSMCPNGGVKYDNYSDILVLSKDPRPLLDAECNKTSTQEDWPKCSLLHTTDAEKSSVGLIGSCGVPKCSASQACDIEVNTSGLNEIYVVHHTSDPWLANIEGAMKNVEICPAE